MFAWGLRSCSQVSVIALGCGDDMDRFHSRETVYLWHMTCVWVKEQ